MPRIRFLGANRQVTGSSYLIEANGSRVLIDCGLYQERCCLDRNWKPFPVSPETIDSVVLTHAHLDHCGLLPKLHADGFHGRVHCTRPTEDLSRIVLEDGARIQEEDVEQKRRRHAREGRVGPHPLRTLYSREDVDSAMSLVDGTDYERAVPLTDSIDLQFHDAGHILGSAIVELIVRDAGRETRVVFSGDLGQYDASLVHDPATIAAADYLIMESTYGDRNHQGDDRVADNLADIVNEAVERGGNLIIPTFAIDRAQDLLFHFGRLVEADRIPRVGVFLDSPMAIDATSIYKQYMYLLDDETRERLEQGNHPFQFRGLHFVRNPSESMRLNTKHGPNIILAGSGMCTGGRVKHHLRHNIERPESTVLFVGFQSQETLGREILDGASRVRIHGRQYDVRAQVRQLSGLSAHADRRDLMRWLGGFRSPPRRMFLTHGEAAAADSLADHVRAELGWDVVVPEYRDQIELS